MSIQSISYKWPSREESYNQIVPSYYYYYTIIIIIDNQTLADKQTITGPQIQLDYFIYLYADLSLLQEDLFTKVIGKFNNLTNFLNQISQSMNLDPEFDPILLNASYLIPNLELEPSLNYTQPEVTSTALRINFTLKNTNGFVAVGIE